jgi:hypothetical protein
VGGFAFGDSVEGPSLKGVKAGKMRIKSVG